MYVYMYMCLYMYICVIYVYMCMCVFYICVCVSYIHVYSVFCSFVTLNPLLTFYPHWMPSDQKFASYFDVFLYVRVTH